MSMAITFGNPGKLPRPPVVAASDEAGAALFLAGPWAEPEASAKARCGFAGGTEVNPMSKQRCVNCLRVSNSCKRASGSGDTGAKALATSGFSKKSWGRVGCILPCRYGGNEAKSAMFLTEQI